METPQQLNPSKDLVKLDEWKAILTHPEFGHTVREYINKRIEDLGKTASRINVEKKTLDGSIEVSHQHSKIEELKQMLSHFERKAKEIRAREEKESFSA